MRTYLPCVLIAVVMLGAVFAACDNGSGGGPAYAPLVITGKDFQSTGVTVTFTAGRDAPREGAPLVIPESGDSYVITLDGETLSQGKIAVTNGTNITFIPKTGERFEGTFINNLLRFAEDAPVQGFVQTAPRGGTPVGTPGGGGGGGGGGAVTYTVTFDANGGTAVPSSATAPLDGTGTVDEPATTRDGYEFAGWYSDTDLTIPYDFSTLVTGNFPLYAKWTRNIYTVTFDVNGGNGTAPTIPPVAGGDSITLPSGAGTYGTYTFGGWNTGRNGVRTEYAAGASYTPEGNITLYARWTTSDPTESRLYIKDADVNDTWSPVYEFPAISGANIAEAVTHVSSHAGEYLMLVSGTIAVSTEPLPILSANSLTVKSSGDATISLTANGSLFTVQSGADLTLGSGITLQGHNGNTASLVTVTGTFTMEGDAAIEGNTSATNGGGVSVSGGIFTMRDTSKVEGNKATAVDSGHSSSGYGGGVYVRNGTFIMEGDAAISDNTASGSGGYVGYGDGGGVYVAGGTFTMKSGTIEHNTVTGYGGSVGYGSGGGVNVGRSGTFWMQGGIISGNTATGSSGDQDHDYGYGGGVFTYGSFTMESGAIISTNTAGGSGYGGGGGVYTGGTFIMRGGIISDNTAVDSSSDYGSGGGVETRGGSFTMKSGTIERNTADSGGGVFINLGTFTMEGDAAISDNTADGSGGGVYIWIGEPFTMRGGTISDNTAGGGGGGVYVSSSETFTMEGGTIERNTAGYGGGVYVSDGTFTKSGTGDVIEYNTAANVGDAVYADTYPAPTRYLDANAPAGYKIDTTTGEGLLPLP